MNAEAVVAGAAPALDREALGQVTMYPILGYRDLPAAIDGYTGCSVSSRWS